MGLIIDGKKPDPVSATWKEDERIVRASGTMQEDVKVGIQGAQLPRVWSASRVGVIYSLLYSSSPKSKNLAFKNKKMCLGSNPYQQRSVFWDEVVRLKCPLPSGTKKEDLKVEIDKDGKLLINISKGVSSHSDLLSSVSSSLIRFGSSFLSFPKKNEGDTARPITPMKFNLPAGLDPNSLETAMDDAGVLTVTFTKLKPEKRKLVSIAKKMLVCLAQAVPACLVIGYKIDDAMSSGD